MKKMKIASVLFIALISLAGIKLAFSACGDNCNTDVYTLDGDVSDADCYSGGECEGSQSEDVTWPCDGDCDSGETCKKQDSTSERVTNVYSEVSGSGCSQLSDCTFESTETKGQVKDCECE